MLVDWNLTDKFISVFTNCILNQFINRLINDDSNAIILEKFKANTLCVKLSCNFQNVISTATSLFHTLNKKKGLQNLSVPHPIRFPKAVTFVFN